MSNALLDALGYVSESLDKPGRAVRGLLGGRPEELANLVPFSDTLGLTDPANRVSGRDLLEKLGVVDPRQEGEGFGLGDIAGMGTEMLLDPTKLLLGGAGLAAYKFAPRIRALLPAAKKAAVAAEAIPALNEADDVTRLAPTISREVSREGTRVAPPAVLPKALMSGEEPNWADLRRRANAGDVAAEAEWSRRSKEWWDTFMSEPVRHHEYMPAGEQTSEWIRQDVRRHAEKQREWALSPRRPTTTVEQVPWEERRGEFLPLTDADIARYKSERTAQSIRELSAPSNKLPLQEGMSPRRGMDQLLPMAEEGGHRPASYYDKATLAELRGTGDTSYHVHFKDVKGEGGEWVDVFPTKQAAAKAIAEARSEGAAAHLVYSPD